MAAGECGLRVARMVFCLLIKKQPRAVRSRGVREDCGEAVTEVP